MALTGVGHGTPKVFRDIWSIHFPPLTPQAILMGLEGELPHLIDPTTINDRVADIRGLGVLTLSGEKVRIDYH